MKTRLAALPGVAPPFQRILPLTLGLSWWVESSIGGFRFYLHQFSKENSSEGTGWEGESGGDV